MSDLILLLTVLANVVTVVTGVGGLYLWNRQRSKTERSPTLVTARGEAHRPASGRQRLWRFLDRTFESNRRSGELQEFGTRFFGVGAGLFGFVAVFSGIQRTFGWLEAYFTIDGPRLPWDVGAAAVIFFSILWIFFRSILALKAVLIGFLFLPFIVLVVAIL